MKKNRILSVALIVSMALLAASCVKEIVSNDEQYRPAGSPISLFASTGYDNGVETRAEYSGEAFPVNGYTNPFERIDWIANDPIRVVYNVNTARNFTVTNTISDDDEISKTELGGNLQWDGSGNHLFYALYPSNGDSSTPGSASGTLDSDGTVKGTIPATQNVNENNKLTNMSETIGIDTYTYNKYQPNTAQYGYLVAYETVAASSTASSVELHFKPAFTTFEFKLHRNTGEPNPKLLSATLSTVSLDGGTTPAVSLAGGFTIKLTGNDGRGATWNKSTTTGSNKTVLTGTLSNSITVNFGSAGVNIPDGNSYLDFSILALPIDLKGVQLTLNFTDGSKVLKFKDNRGTASEEWHEFEGAKKYIITNIAPSGDWEYFIEEIPDLTTYGHEAASQGFNVWSYRVNTLDNTIKQIVPWKVQYYNGTTWVDLTGSGAVDNTLNATYNVASLTGIGALPTNPAESNTASVSGTTPINQDESSQDTGAGARAKLASTPARGNANQPFDLSMHPFYGTDAEIRTKWSTMNTANCYVVSAPGVYEFPCVYGNAIMNSTFNTSAYDPAHADDALSGVIDPNTNTQLTKLRQINSTFNTSSYAAHYYLPTFYNAWEEPIASPYIVTDCNISPSVMDAIVVWQDTAPGNEIIPFDSNSSNGNSSTVIGTRQESVTGLGTVDYIWFKIDAEDIKPGNIMIALRDGGTIVWSWHIWVTEKDLKPSSSDSYTLTLDDNTTATFTLLPYNLGWLDSSTGAVTKYKDRSIPYRIVQVDGNNAILSEGYKANGVDHGEPFTFTQLGDAKTIAPTVGGNPYYQWGRKDPMIGCTETGADRPYSKNPTIGTITPGYGVSVAHSGIRDFHTAIQNPYTYYSNDQTLGWMGGQAHPYFKTTFMMRRVNSRMTEPYTHAQALKFFDYGLLPGPSTLANINNYFTTRSDNFLKLNTNAPLHLGPYTAAQKDNILSIDDVDPTGDHFQPGDFSNGYTPAEKLADMACPYNLWNSYIFSDQPTRGSYDPDHHGDGSDLPAATNAAEHNRNKFKTIYDPCPVGFTVPTKASYIGDARVRYGEIYNGGVLAERWKSVLGSDMSNHFTFVPAQNAPFVTGSVGVTVNGILFPYTGGRVCYNHGVNTPIELIPEHQGDGGYYWCDNPLAMEPQAQNVYDINSFFFYQHAYMFLLNRNPDNGNMGYSLHYFTRGSAGCIRPMVDPKFTTPAPAASSSSAAPIGSINSFNNGGELPE